MGESERFQIEATGETVGEAKWTALRELEKLQPGIDKAAVQFQVLSEGERGLLGVGYTPARVLASVDPAATVAPAPAPAEEPASELGGEVREILQQILEAIGVASRVELREDDESLVATVAGRELGLVIGKHGQTIDAIQYLVNAIVWRAHGDERKPVVVDVGSGGGAPGIPLAVALPEREVTLLESSRRKCEFLERWARELPNARVVCGRAEEQPLDSWEVAVAKALAPPTVAAEWCLPLVAPGGAAILYAGPSAEGARVARVAGQLGAELAESPPGLLVLRKLEPTPAGFPRRPGVARKRPLA